MGSRRRTSGEFCTRICSPRRGVGVGGEKRRRGSFAGLGRGMTRACRQQMVDMAEGEGGGIRWRPRPRGKRGRLTADGGERGKHGRLGEGLSVR